MKQMMLLGIFFVCGLQLIAQVQSGPMPGYAEMQEVAIWVQTKQQAAVSIRYENINNSSDVHWTNKLITKQENAFTAVLIADSVEPGNIYSYRLYMNNKHIPAKQAMTFKTPPLWQHQTNPPDIRFASGSCAYINEKKYDRPGKPYGGDYQIFNSIIDKKPDFMLWLGDNVYFRRPDWNSWTGIVHRYTHDRSIPEIQALLSGTNHYAIWDDHDFGPNNSDRSFWNKEMTKKAFEIFWANPSYGMDGLDGITTFFNWGDLDFFLLDNRYDRSPNRRRTGKRTILGKKQLLWLKDALSFSQAHFKFVVMGGQFLNDAAKYEMYSNYGFDEERREIIEFIQTEQIRNVIFISGDRHHSELSYLPGKDDQPDIYDITLSPLTSGPHTSADKEKNTLRVENTLVMKRNFGLFDIKTVNDKRILTISVFHSDGQLLWNYEVESQKDN